MPGTGPLAGVRVIDLTMWIQGPIAATLLADLGADVIKVEKAGVGDHGRSLQSVYGVDMRRGDSPQLLWTVCNRNKRALALDLAHIEARPAFEALVRSADVFITNLMIEPLLRFEAHEEAIRALNPRIVYARASGFGEAGPWANDPCQDTLGMAYAGLLMTCSPDGRQPYYPPGALSDVLSGTMLAFAILAALRERDRTGEGQYTGTSQVQTLLWLQTLNVGAVANLGQAFEASDRTAPPNPMFNTYLCGDGRWMALGMAVQAMWPVFCEQVGRPDLVADPRYATMESRRANARALVAELDAMFLTQPREHWLSRMRERGLWVGPINRVDDLLADEQVRANGYLLTLDNGWVTPGMPFTLRGHEPGTAPGPEHGADTEAILRELGFGDDAITRLRASGAAW
jgi:crotonobetainyl-CoA:carnitine CoA-transferase CaiB-like acyl-CoA transferase